MKRLFVCCDGTSNDAIKSEYEAITNVSRFATCIKAVADGQSPADDKILQIVYYRKGPEQAITGRDIDDIIQEAYHFICHNYDFEGNEDEIHLIGFSRGAFAVRALACFIADVGLFKKTGLGFIPGVYKKWGLLRDSLQSKKTTVHQMGHDDPYPSRMDRNTGDVGKKIVKNQKFDRNTLDELGTEWEGDGKLKKDVRITSCAVWDTVGNIRVNVAWKSDHLKWVEREMPARLSHAFQALALGETRKEFLPVLWNPSVETNVKQCWFRGDHSDIGGGHADSGLASIALLWMVAQFREHLPRVVFDEKILLDFMTPMSIKWGLNQFSFESHGASEGNPHGTFSLSGLSGYGLVDPMSRQSLLHQAPLVHSTVRMMMANEPRKSWGANHPLLLGRFPFLHDWDEQNNTAWRIKWHKTQNDDEAHFTEDRSTDWESRTFRQWLKREHHWRNKHPNAKEMTPTALYNKLYEHRHQMVRPTKRTLLCFLRPENEPLWPDVSTAPDRLPENQIPITLNSTGSALEYPINKKEVRIIGGNLFINGRREPVETSLSKNVPEAGCEFSGDYPESGSEE